MQTRTSSDLRLSSAKNQQCRRIASLLTNRALNLKHQVVKAEVDSPEVALTEAEVDSLEEALIEVEVVSVEVTGVVSAVETVAEAVSEVSANFNQLRDDILF